MSPPLEPREWSAIFPTHPVCNITGEVHWIDYWHWLDAFVVFTSIIDFIISVTTGSTSTGISVLRLTRVLRVLRVIGAVDTMIYLVTALVNGLK